MKLKPFLLLLAVFLFSNFSFSQQQNYVIDNRNHFWDKVQFGGGLGLGIGSGYTDISVMMLIRSCRLTTFSGTKDGNTQTPDSISIKNKKPPSVLTLLIENAREPFL